MSALTGIRFCDFTGQLAGAAATKWMAAFGAEVIRIEDPTNQGAWDVLRNTPPFVDERRGTDLGGGFNNHNVGKLGITLNLKTARGREILEEIVARSDVVTENFAAGVLERLGFGYERLRAIKPDIIYVSNCGFGHSGPYRDFKTWGPIVQALSGLTFNSGLPGKEPAGWGFSYMDHTGGHYMSMAILLALFHRMRTGEGQWVDMACCDTGLTLHGPALLDYTVNGRKARREGRPIGNRSEWPAMAPHGIYRAKGEDQWIAIACRSDADWQALSGVIGEDWASAPQWCSLEGRIAGQDELDGRMDEWCAGRDKVALHRQLQHAGLAAAAVLEPRERIDEDPANDYFDLWPTVSHSEMGEVRVDGLPVRMSRTPQVIERGAPCLGEHTEQVLTELLGMDTQAVAALREEGVDMSALAGVRVIELASERCALAGKLLADMGADVVVVEPLAGAVSRSYAPFAGDVPGPERSLHWWHYNTSKRGLALDWTMPEGRDALMKLIGGADLLLEAEDPGVLAAVGLDDATLTGMMPRLIHVSITPFGPEGPRSMEQATDLTLLASSGVALSCGYDDHDLPPIRPIGDHGFAMGEHFAVQAALTALIFREGSGEGQKIDVSLNAAANVTTELSSYTWLVAQQQVQRQTGRHAGTIPSMPTQYRCKDGRYVNTGVPPRTGKQFKLMLEWFSALGFDKHFPETVFLEMGTHHPVLDLSKIGIDDEVTAIFAAAREALAYACSQMTAYDFFESAQKANIPVGIIYSPDEAFEDVHFKSRGFQVEMDQPQLGRKVRYPGAPYALPASPWRLSRVAPSLGEHTNEVLAEAGIDAEELRRSGAIV